MVAINLSYNGQSNWVKTFDAGGKEKSECVSYDKSNYTYVVSFLFDSVLDCRVNNVFIYDSLGNVLQNLKYNVEKNNFLSNQKIKIDFANNIIVAATEFAQNKRNVVIYQYSAVTGLLDEKKRGNNIVVYPNPIKDSFWINQNSIIFDKVELIDITGKKLLQESLGLETRIDVQILPSGIFFLRFSNQSGNIYECQKIIIE